MSELRELYQEVILDHNKRPRNFGALADYSGKAEGFNTLCGDRVSVTVKVEDGRLEDIAFQGCGCAISQASASLMTECLKGRTVEDAREQFEKFHKMLADGMNVSWDEDGLEALAALEGVKEFPIRVKCATLPWHTMMAAFENSAGAVKTE